MTSLRIIFMGSPDFAVPVLRAICPRHQVLAVVTQPDRPQGRGQVLTPPPVKSAALELGLVVLQPEKLRTKAMREQLDAFGAEVFVVAAYGKILSDKMLAVPPLGCVNVHASLLPKYRGAAPIQWAVINGERESGITIMRMDKGMDTGPILLQRSLTLHSDETGGSLHDRLAPLGAELMLEALEGLARPGWPASPQPSSGAIMAPMFAKDDGWVDFHQPATRVDCWIRGMDPWPGAFTCWGTQRLKLFRSTVALDHHGAQGEVLTSDKRGLLVACGSGAVWIKDLQLPGRKRLLAQALLAGRPIAPGTRLGLTAPRALTERQ
jgi:methionyl-tRNA formyltransferase